VKNLLSDIKKIKSDKKDLRKFGLLVGGVLVVVSAFFFWREKPTYPYFGIAGAVLVSLGLVFPRLLIPLQKAWMTIAVVIGWIQTRLILTLLYFAILTPTKFIVILFRKDILGERLDKGAESYWNRIEKKTGNKKDCEKSF